MKIGDKVVYVHKGHASVESNPRYWMLGEHLKIGRVYVIQNFAVTNGHLGLILIGSTAGIDHFETGWDARCFRLLDQLQEENRERDKRGLSADSAASTESASAAKPQSGANPA
jgi:hypothetical protein